MCRVQDGKDRDVFAGTRKECNAYVAAHRASLGYWLIHKRTAWGWQLVTSALTAGHVKIA